MPYGFMYSASAWQCEHVVAILVGCTLDRGSEGARKSCTPWQSVHTATLASPFAHFMPWTLVLYCWNWSTRSPGLYFFIRSASEWQEAQSSGICLRSILPFHPAVRLIALSGSSLLASPPWHAAQVSPFWAWMFWL